MRINIINIKINNNKNFFSMDELERLLAEGCDSPKQAARLRIAVQCFTKETKMKEEKYLARIVSLGNEKLELEKFFSLMAHDLRRPIGNIQEMAIILVEEGQFMPSEDLMKFYNMLARTSSNTYQILVDLLEWSKIRTNRRELNLQKTFLGAIMLKVKMLTSTFAESKGILIEDKISVDSELMCDPFILETILRNLIDNAIKFSVKGAKISISSKVTKSNVEIFVSDQGIGMSKEMVGKMFQLSSSIQRPGTDNEKSSGLGLLLCKELVTLHGGEIWVESEEGIGSTFRFTIPLSDDSYQSGQPTALYNQVLNTNFEN